MEELLGVVAARRKTTRLADLERGLERGDLVEIAAEERHTSLVRDPSRESSNAGLAPQRRPEGPGEPSERRFDRGAHVRSCLRCEGGEGREVSRVANPVRQR